MSAFNKKQQLSGLGIWLLVAFTAAAVGSIGSIQAPLFYAELTRPEWAPPGWLFGPVWTLLYLMMAVSAWLVWRLKGFEAARIPLLCFMAQLLVNALWSWLFFTWNLGGLAFANILLLMVFILATMIYFWRVRPLAAVLLAPYLGWVMFAGLLNYWVWQMNPMLLG